MVEPLKPPGRAGVYLKKIMQDDFNTTEQLIPANAEIQKHTGFRVNPGMTNRKKFRSLHIEVCRRESDKLLYETK
jgi:hypothetical protein